MKKTPKKKIEQKEKKIGIQPLGDRVLVRPMTVEEVEGKKRSFDFVLPESMKNEKSAQGVVLAVGEGAYRDGKLVAIRIKVGDTVLFSKYAYDEVRQDGEDLYLLKEEHVLAIIK